MEMLERLENLRAEEASVQKLFGNEGIRTKKSNPAYQKRFQEALKLVTEVIQGTKPVHYLRETMTTSDFPILFGDIVDRILLAAYREMPQTYKNFTKIMTVRDFREIKMIGITGAEAPLEPVAEQAEYPEVGLGEEEYSLSVQKYGRRVPFSWEAMVNDDLGALRDIPARLGRAARRTEERFVTGMFVESTGPNSTFFTVGNNNVVPGNPALSLDALQAALTLLTSHVDTDGEPIFIDMVHLIVPPALEIAAMNLLNATQLELTESGSGTKLMTANWMRNRLQLTVSPYLPHIDTTSGNTAWYLFADANQSRPAVQMAFLRGHEEPEIWMKKPDAVRISGGEVGVMDGSFDTDSVDYRIRHVFGGGLMDPKAAVASTGQGSGSS